MKYFYTLISFLSFMYLPSYGQSPKIDDDSRTLNFRVMQFNILQGWDVFNESETVGYSWLDRRDAVVKMIKADAPDIICVQEARKKQCSWLAEQLPSYAQVLYPKDGIESNGGQRDLIMYRKDKFECLQWKYFWFSETPYVSSYSWDAGTPKITILAQFKSLVANGEGKGKTFWVYNTHFFPSGDIGKQKCSDMIVTSIMKETGINDPVILCGDLNLQYGDSRLDTLLSCMHDAAVTAPESDGPLKVTYNGFRENNLKTLDHIYGRNLIFKTYRVDNSEEYGIRWISDHYPLYADVQIPLTWTDTVTYTSTADTHLECKWIRSVNDPHYNFHIGDATSNRGLCLTPEGILYSAERQSNTMSSPSFLYRYEASSGDYLETLTLDPSINVKTYPCNDITVDDAGHLLTYNYTISLSTAPLIIHQIDPITGQAVQRASIKTSSVVRTDCCHISGDVEKGDFDVWVPVNSKGTIYRFTFLGGTLTDETSMTAQSYCPTSATSFGLNTRLLPINDTLVLVNGSNIYPTLYNFKTGAIASTLGTEALPSEEGMKTNGCCTFSLKGKHFIVYPSDDYTSSTGYRFCIASISHPSLLSSALPLWKIPQNGFGNINNTHNEALATCTVNASADTASIYLYVPGNGVACYTMTYTGSPSAIQKTQMHIPGLTLTDRILSYSGTAMQISLFDMNGRCIASTRQNSLEISPFQKGTYIVRIQTPSGYHAQKLNISY